MSFKEHLSTKTCKDIVTTDNKEIISFKHDESLSGILDTLVEKKIFAAPILAEDGVEYAGMVSLLDALEALLEVWNKGRRGNHLLDLFTTAVARCLESGFKAKDRAKSDSLVMVSEDAAASDVLEMMSKEHIHRVFLLKDLKVCAVVTQSDIVKFLSKEIDCFESLMSKSLEQLGIVYEDIIVMKADTLVLEAFDKMVQLNIRAFPVVVENNVAGVISSSDFHILADTKMNQDITRMTCLQFLQLKHSRDFKARIPTFTLQKDALLGDVMHRMCSLKVHRMYVVSGPGGEISGTVTLGSIIKGCLAN